MIRVHLVYVWFAYIHPVYVQPLRHVSYQFIHFSFWVLSYQYTHFIFSVLKWPHQLFTFLLYFLLDIWRGMELMEVYGCGDEVAQKENVIWDIRLTLNAHIFQSINYFEVIQIGGNSLFRELSKIGHMTNFAEKRESYGCFNEVWDSLPMGPATKSSATCFEHRPMSSGQFTRSGETPYYDSGVSSPGRARGTFTLALSARSGVGRPT